MPPQTYHFTIELEPGESGGFVVSVPALPGCFTQGRTYEEAIEMAKDAIACYLGGLMDEGVPIPEEAHPQPINMAALGVEVRVPQMA